MDRKAQVERSLPERNLDHCFACGMCFWIVARVPRGGRHLDGWSRLCGGHSGAPEANVGVRDRRSDVRRLIFFSYWRYLDGFQMSNLPSSKLLGCLAIYRHARWLWPMLASPVTICCEDAVDETTASKSEEDDAEIHLRSRRKRHRAEQSSSDQSATLPTAMPIVTEQPPWATHRANYSIADVLDARSCGTAQGKNMPVFFR